MPEPRKIDNADLINRFAFHPADENRAKAHELAREVCYTAALALATLCPPGRELSLAITHLEDSMFWSNAAIARQVD